MSYPKSETVPCFICISPEQFESFNNGKEITEIVSEEYDLSSGNLVYWRAQ
jgi:hypothetical protein